MSDEVTLTVNGTKFRGWEDVTVNRNIDALAHSFSLSVSSRWSQESKPVPIRVGDSCTIKINDELVITGYIDDFTEDDGPDRHSIDVSGRAKTGDLVDSSAILPNWQLRKKKIEDIAAELCEPFGISVDLIDPNPLESLDTGDKIKVFRIDHGETVYEALTRLTRSEGLLLSTSPAGNLELSRAASIPTLGAFITRGINTKGGRYSSSGTDRYSQYILKSQTGGDDDTSGAAAAQLEDTQVDDEVTRYRPLLMLAETPRDRRSLKTRAKWERNRRAASSERISYQLQGWGTLAGLWRPNILVPVKDDRFGILDNMLVSGAALTQSREAGTIATVEVTGPEAYDIFNPPKRRRKR